MDLHRKSVIVAAFGLLSLAGCAPAQSADTVRVPMDPPADALMTAHAPQRHIDVLRQLEGPEGLKVTPLFTEKVPEKHRLDRLEYEVQHLRNDVDTIAPPMVRLVTLEKELERMKAQMDAQFDVQPAQDQTVNTGKVASGKVAALRFGDHPDRARLVMDVTTDKADIGTRMENNGQRLRVDLAGLTWDMKQSAGGNVSQLVSGWKLDDGTLVVDLLGPATVKAQEYLPPLKAGGPYRIVIDLHSPALHR